MSTKNDILKVLLENDSYTSGESLADHLQVSRNAVWKAIRQLRTEGYRIEAVTNRGYRLASDPDRISEAAISRWLVQHEIGSPMEIHEKLDSTNIRAKQLAMQDAPHGLLVAADSQTSGRGRFGRNFFSPEHSGIYLSYILRPQMPASEAVMVTSMAAVAVARAIEALAPVSAGIKWVNDIYINGRKACGILCEASLDFESGQLQYVVLGIGVNVKKMAFPDELAGIATSIENECGQAVSRTRLIAEISNQLALLYPDLSKAGFMEESRRRSIVIGKDVMVHGSSDPYPAHAETIDDHGQLIIRLPDGSSRAVGSGEISIKLQR